MPNERRSQGCHCRKYIDEISRNARLEEEVARLKRENSRLREQLGRVRRTALVVRGTVPRDLLDSANLKKS